MVIQQLDEFSYEATRRSVEGAEHLSYHEAGSGDGLLLLHGSGPGVTGWSNFQGNLPVFARHFRTMILDQPGFGMSSAPTLGSRPYHEHSIDAIVRLLDALELSSVHIVGNSMGGRVAAEFALAQPERVDRLVLMGGGGLGINLLAPSPSEGIRRLVDFNKTPTRERLVEWLESMVADPAILTDRLVDERLENVNKPGALEWSRAFRNHRLGGQAEPDVPLWARGSSIKHRTLLTWGRDDRVVPLEHALVPLRQLPNVELHVFARCGHWAMIERKEEFERVVIEFLTRPGATAVC
jgi:4,5:9,10-diseco-3-hydroxy-5,9,17-trioxoandrosta-1(10),2-diene-4-oate hydrolase